MVLEEGGERRGHVVGVPVGVEDVQFPGEPVLGVHCGQIEQ